MVLALLPVPLIVKARYKVAEAPGGREGIARYRQEPADVVITDILMPEKDGLEVIRELKREFPDVKTIAMSSKPAYFSLALDSSKFSVTY